VHQFPLYESFLVACVGCMFTWARMEAGERPSPAVQLVRHHRHLIRRLAELPAARPL